MTCVLSASGWFILFSPAPSHQKPRQGSAFFAAGNRLDRYAKLCDFAKNKINIVFPGSVMEKVSFPYRSSSHLILMHVVAESGAWEKHGLQVDYDYKIGSEDAQAGINSGELEFCGG